MKHEKQQRSAFYGVIFGIVILTLVLSEAFVSQRPRFTGVVPKLSSSSDIDTIIHAGHYISRMKGSAEQSGFNRFKELHTFFGDLIEKSSLKLSEKETVYFHSITKQLEKYVSFRTLRSEGINEPLFWPTLLNGQHSPHEILNEKSQEMAPKSHLKSWEFSSKALSMNPFSRYVGSLASVFGLQNNDHKISTKASHFMRGRCEWNPYGPPNPDCMVGAQKTTEPQIVDPASEMPPIVENPEDPGHLLLKLYFQKFPKSQSLAVDDNSENLLEVFQSGGSDAVASSLFLEKGRATHFRAAVLMSFELARLEGPVDQEDNLFARHLELFSRKSTLDSNSGHSDSGALLSEENWLKIAREGWPM